MKELSTNWRFWLFRVLASFSFPVAGMLALFVVPVTTPVHALIAGPALVWPWVLRKALPSSEVRPLAMSFCGEAQLRDCALALRRGCSFSESYPYLNLPSGLGLGVLAGLLDGV